MTSIGNVIVVDIKEVCNKDQHENFQRYADISQKKILRPLILKEAYVQVPLIFLKKVSGIRGYLDLDLFKIKGATSQYVDIRVQVHLSTLTSNVLRSSFFSCCTHVFCFYLR